MKRRPKRGKNRHFMDNIIQDTYAPLLGGNAIAVYAALSRMANIDTQQCWPSYQTIADKAGVSRSTAVRSIERLESFGLIFVESRVSVETGNTSNLYTMLEPPAVPKSDAPLCHSDTTPYVTGTLPPMSQGHPPSVTVTQEQYSVKRTNKTGGDAEAPPAESHSTSESEELDFGYKPNSPAGERVDWTNKEVRDARLLAALSGKGEMVGGLEPEDESPATMRSRTKVWLREVLGPKFCEYTTAQPDTVIIGWSRAATDILAGVHAQIAGSKLEDKTWSAAKRFVLDALAVLFSDERKEGIHPRPWAKHAPTYAGLYAAKADILYVTSRLIERAAMEQKSKEPQTYVDRPPTDEELVETFCTRGTGAILIRPYGEHLVQMLLDKQAQMAAEGNPWWGGRKVEK